MNSHLAALMFAWIFYPLPLGDIRFRSSAFKFAFMWKWDPACSTQNTSLPSNSHENAVCCVLLHGVGALLWFDRELVTKNTSMAVTIKSWYQTAQKQPQSLLQPDVYTGIS